MFGWILSRLGSALVAIALHGALLWFALPSVVRPPVVERSESVPLIARLLFEDQSSEHVPPPTFETVTLHAWSEAFSVRPPKLPEIEAVAADSFAQSRKIVSSEDLAEVERLQKLYVGQINARLARLLEDAGRSSITVASECRMHVIQDERGNVLDVTTEECETDIERRDRLVRAIRGASPLPLPPQGLAMGSYLTLDLTEM